MLTRWMRRWPSRSLPSLRIFENPKEENWPQHYLSLCELSLANHQQSQITIWLWNEQACRLFIHNFCFPFTLWIFLFRSLSWSQASTEWTLERNSRDWLIQMTRMTSFWHTVNRKQRNVDVETNISVKIALCASTTWPTTQRGVG